ncbi:hypothetical protein, partial [Turicimonas muris]|uniref:hypothetical protein n=1 Tax=Turicimonas muris TaxID=1796652 RepID=UPI002594B24E
KQIGRYFRNHPSLCRSNKLFETLVTMGNHRYFSFLAFSHLIKEKEASASGMPASPATIKNQIFNLKT